MSQYLDLLRQKVLSKELEESVAGIDECIKVVDSISDTFLQALKASNDKFIITERISLLFYSYLNKLKNISNDDDSDSSFWASSLILHYGIRNSKAEQILLNSIAEMDLDKVFVAIIILGKIKSPMLSHCLSEKLKDATLSDKVRTFFKEKLKDISEW